MTNCRPLELNRFPSAVTKLPGAFPSRQDDLPLRVHLQSEGRAGRQFQHQHNDDYGNDDDDEDEDDDDDDDDDNDYDEEEEDDDDERRIVLY